MRCGLLLRQTGLPHIGRAPACAPFGSPSARFPPKVFRLSAVHLCTACPPNRMSISLRFSSFQLIVHAELYLAYPHHSYTTIGVSPSPTRVSRLRRAAVDICNRFCATRPCGTARSGHDKPPDGMPTRTDRTHSAGRPTARCDSKRQELARDVPAGQFVEREGGLRRPSPTLDGVSDAPYRLWNQHISLPEQYCQRKAHWLLPGLFQDRLPVRLELYFDRWQSPTTPKPLHNFFR